MRYTSKGLRRRGDTDKWEVTLSHKDPLSGEVVRSYHAVTARTDKQARRRRDDLIRDLERRGLSAGSQMTISELADLFIEYKADSGTIERSTLDGYRKQMRALKREIGDIRVCDLSIPDVNSWMASMTERGYAPRSVKRPFALLKQMMKYAMAMDLVTKNPCEFCKPPKIQRKKVNALSREERTRMMRLAREAEPPLGLAIELALTTGMRRGEICGLRWSDLGDCEVTVTLNTYGEVDPEAKRAAVSKVSEAFDIDDTLFDERRPYGVPAQPGITISFTAD